jgi:hypothetical protein
MSVMYEGEGSFDGWHGNGIFYRDAIWTHMDSTDGGNHVMSGLRQKGKCQFSKVLFRGDLAFTMDNATN